MKRHKWMYVYWFASLPPTSNKYISVSRDGMNKKKNALCSMSSATLSSSTGQKVTTHSIEMKCWIHFATNFFFTSSSFLLLVRPDIIEWVLYIYIQRAGMLCQCATSISISFFPRSVSVSLMHSPWSNCDGSARTKKSRNKKLALRCMCIWFLSLIPLRIIECSFFIRYVRSISIRERIMIPKMRATHCLPSNVRMFVRQL